MTKREHPEAAAPLIPPRATVPALQAAAARVADALGVELNPEYATAARADDTTLAH